VIEVLERVLRRDPNHPGANHYFIHALEASRSPERALPSAMRLGALMPARDTWFTCRRTSSCASATTNCLRR
jgi:hypothetical protein